MDRSAIAGIMWLRLCALLVGMALFSCGLPQEAIVQTEGVALPAGDPGLVKLSENWRLYPAQLCTGADCRDGAVWPAPLLWQDGVHPQVPGMGFGTYVLQVSLPEAYREAQLALMLFDVGSSYRLLVNGQEIGRLGRVGTSAAESEPDVRPAYHVFRAQGPQMTLAIQVANFVHPRGGLRAAPLLGLSPAIFASRDQSLFRNLLLLGVILGMAFYHLGLFLNRREDQPALWFALFCFAWALRMLTTDEVILLAMVPDLDYGVQIRLEYISFIVAGPLFVSFLNQTYPFTGSRQVTLVLLTLGGLICAFVLLSPTPTFPRYLLYFQLLTLLCVLAGLFVLSLALLQQKPGAMAAVFGGVVACVAAVNDVLFYRDISPVGPIFHYGLLIFILAQSYLLARLFAAAYRSANDLSLNLRDTNAALARFVPTEFLDLLQKTDITQIRLGDQVQQNMSVMFTDIRSFTRLSEQMSPTENFNFLNSYLRRMTPLVNARGGFIDKYIGDAVMALFGGKPDAALLAAIDMHRELRVYNRHRANLGYERIAIGIGIHTGDIMLGIIGHENRMEGTVISDAVNTAARIEQLTRRYGSVIMVSDETVEQLERPSDFALRTLGRVRVKGRSRAVRLHEVLNGHPPELADLYGRTVSDFEQAVSLAYSRQYESALRAFEAVLRINPADRAAQFYRKRMRELLGLAETESS